MTTIYFRGTRAELLDKVNDFASIIATGSPNEPIAMGFLNSIGMAALSSIYDAYITKADGGTDEMGITWPPLSPKTLAYGRRAGPNDPQLPNVNPLRPSLTAAQDLRWRRVFYYMWQRFLLSMEDGPAKRRAAAVAWNTVKSEGATTKLELYGSRPHKILRDTGVLLNSLSPGTLTFDTYNPTNPDQVFRVEQGQVIIGSNVAYAATHNYGDPKRNIPKRQFLPDEDGGNIPDSWWEDWLDTATLALEEGATLFFQSN
jgi:hypothetical protein